MNDNNNDKLVFELKDLSYSDLINLYRDIIAFNEHVDTIINDVSKVDDGELPAEAVEVLNEASSEEKTEGEENTSTEEENAPEEAQNSESESTENTQEENNTEVKPEEKTEEAK